MIFHSIAQHLSRHGRFLKKKDSSIIHQKTEKRMLCIKYLKRCLKAKEQLLLEWAIGYLISETSHRPRVLKTIIFFLRLIRIWKTNQDSLALVCLETNAKLLAQSMTKILKSFQDQANTTQTYPSSSKASLLWRESTLLKRNKYQ